MARCGCNNACGCALVAGDGIKVDGTGSGSNPWVISTDAMDFSAASPGCGIEFADSEVRVNTSASWNDGGGRLDFPCSEFNGEPVYCDSNGELRVAPPFRSANYATPGDGGTGPNLGFTGDSASNGMVLCPNDYYQAPESTYSALTVMNPSSCREYDVLFSAEGIIGWTISEDRPTRDQVVFRVGMLFGFQTPLIAPGDPGSNNWEQLQQNRPRVDIGQQLETISVTPWSLPITLPPGGSTTVYAAMWAENVGDPGVDGCFTLRASRTRISATGRSK